ncbi:hypothetical protein [Rahnella phage Sarma103]|nr:hypothetical protein [Rahnella phage Sarma103]
MVALFVITMYALIASVFLNDYRKGLKVHKANFSHFTKWGAPRFTVRLPNGRFKANKVGMFYIATH